MSTGRHSEPPAWEVFKRACELQRAGRISEAFDVFGAVMMSCGWHRTDVAFGRGEPRRWFETWDRLSKERGQLIMRMLSEPYENRGQWRDDWDRWNAAAGDLIDKGGFVYAQQPRRWRTLVRSVDRMWGGG